MASSNVDLERGDAGFKSGHELALVLTADSQGSQSTNPASCGGPPAMQVSGENPGPAPHGVQDQSSDPAHSISAHSISPTRPSEVPEHQGLGNSGKQEGQQTPTVEPDSMLVAPFWTKYNEKAQKDDEALMERLGGSANSLLIFAGLFAVAVTAFIIESCKNLSPDSGDVALVYLAFISQQLAAASQSTGQANATMQLPLPTPQPFVLTRSSIKVNILWILSLIFSIVAALAATLVQSWLTRYKRLASRSLPQPEQRASERSYYFRGVVQFRLVALAEALPALLHISLFLFLVGLMVFLFPINEEVAGVITGFIMTFVALYLVLTIMPIFAQHAPYRTPFTAIYDPLLDVVLRCWLGVIAFCRSSAELLDIGERVWQVLWNLEHVCNAHRRCIGDNYPARTFDDKRIAEAMDWLISQLTTDEEHEALMSTLIPLFTHPSKTSSEWLKLFGLDQPPMPLRYLVPHLPSILDSCLTPVQGTTSRRSPGEYDRHRHLQSCQAVVLNMVQTPLIELDVLFPALLSLRRLRNDQDPFIASHAGTTTTLFLADASWRVSIQNHPSLRIPREWKLMDILSWVDSCSNDDFVSHYPIILDVLAASLLPLSSASMLDHRVHSRRTATLRQYNILTIGERAREEDTIIIPPEEYCFSFSLIALNELLGQLLNSDRLSNLAPPDPESPLDIQLLVRRVETIFRHVRSISTDISFPSLSHDIERTLIHHTETIVDHLESESSNRQAVDGCSVQPRHAPLSSIMTEDAVDSLMLIVKGRLSDPDARSRGSALSNLFEERHSVWFRKTSTD